MVHAKVVLEVDQIDLPPNAASGMEVALMIGDQKIRAKVERIENGRTEGGESGGDESRQEAGGPAWGLVAAAAALLALLAVGFWTWRSRSGSLGGVDDGWHGQEVEHSPSPQRIQHVATTHSAPPAHFQQQQQPQQQTRGNSRWFNCGVNRVQVNWVPVRAGAADPEATSHGQRLMR